MWAASLRAAALPLAGTKEWAGPGFHLTCLTGWDSGLFQEPGHGAQAGLWFMSEGKLRCGSGSLWGRFPRPPKALRLCQPAAG